MGFGVLIGETYRCKRLHLKAGIGLMASIVVRD